jgi:DNA-binding beta-propeller fold protein YncE
MRELRWACVLAIAAAALGGAAAEGRYGVLRTARVGGEGGFDYVYADEAGRNLYIPRLGVSGRISVFNLDTLEPVGEIPHVAAHGVAVSAVSRHGFATGKPVAMWDSGTLALIKTIDVGGSPDGILYDPFDDRVYIFSHKAPNATVIDASDGTVAGTIDLGGEPEQAATDGRGHIYVDLEDKGEIAVVDAASMALRGRYSLAGRGGACAGLAIDVEHQILFVACRKPPAMVILSAEDGRILAALPIGQGTDGAVFDAHTMEAFSSQRDGTLTVVKENGPTSFSVEQNVRTMVGAKTLALDAGTDRVFLIAAENGSPATASSGGYGGRGPMVQGPLSILVVGK